MGKRCGNCANGTWTKGMDAVPEVCLKCEYVHGEPSNWKEKTMTNADRIRAMSDEELAAYLHEIGWDCNICSECERLSDNPLLRYERCDEKCEEHCLEWLKQPAEVE